MSNHNFIVPPRLWSKQDNAQRRVTWLELFFDLIFVAAIAQVGVRLNADYSMAGLFRYIFLFVLIWWAWTGHTLFSARFDTDDVVQRGLTFIQIFTVAAMAANAKDALDSRSSAGFGAAYAAMRIILVIQYIRARKIPATRQLTTHYAIGFGAAAFLWLISAFAPVPIRYWIWGIALVIDMATPLLALNDGAKFPPDAAHLPERFGLFTIILLGESVAAVMRGMESQEYWSISAAASAILGLCLTFTIWWWYFDGAHGAAERPLKTKKQTKLFHLWSYAHLPLYLGIAVVAVGAEHVISMAPEANFRSSESWIISVAAFVAMTALVTIGFTSNSAPDERQSGSHPEFKRQYLIAALALPVGFFGDKCSPVFLVLGLAILCACQLLLALKQNFQLVKSRTSPEVLDFG